MHGSQLCVAVSDVYRITTEPNPQKAKGLHEKGNKTHTQACTCKKKRGGGGGGGGIEWTPTLDTGGRARHGSHTSLFRPPRCCKVVCGV